MVVNGLREDRTVIGHAARPMPIAHAERNLENGEVTRNLRQAIDVASGRPRQPQPR